MPSYNSKETHRTFKGSEFGTNYKETFHVILTYISFMVAFIGKGHKCCYEASYASH